MGAWDVTVTVSWRAPTGISPFTVAVKPVVSTIPSRLTVMNPASVNVTTKVPGLSETILYSPSESVTTVRTPSMRTGLDASTVTPGNTAPDVSFTTPAMPWANITAGIKSRTAATTPTHVTRFRTIAPSCRTHGISQAFYASGHGQPRLVTFNP